MNVVKSVFLNVPFDPRFQPLFVTLVGTLVVLGQKPRCVLEITETGQGRLERIFQLVGSCEMSIHDLSRVGTPVRFNMPFELGLACSLALSNRKHEIVVMDSEPYRLDQTLSDYKGRDPLIHRNSCDELVSCLLDLVSISPPLPSPSAARSLAKELRATARELCREMKTPSVFRPSLYKAIVAAAAEIAVSRGFIAP
ncbi:MAG: hypothetical protein ABI609_03565 [Acidobacteriota bacterium]